MANVNEVNLYKNKGNRKKLIYCTLFSSLILCGATTSATAEVIARDSGVTEVNGNGGIGIPAMDLAVDVACRQSADTGMSVLAIRDVGHTGRLGEFTERAAQSGHLAIVVGGGGREKWRQVAPHGGRQALLPTNPYSIGIPGGDRGPVVLDFATSKIAGGWIYAARSAGALLPDNTLIDRTGQVTRDPEDYFRGGAILPSGEAKGYALSVMAEMIGEAMLGPVSTECNWLMITVDTTRFRAPLAMQGAAESVLAELRDCPTLAGVEQVEVPGERERDYRDRNPGLSLPERTWRQIVALHQQLIRHADDKR